MSFRKLIVLALVCAAAVAAATSARSPVKARTRASLSDDLLAFEASRSAKAVRVIAHGSESQLRELAARHGVHIHRFLDNAAVFEATTAQIEALRDEPAVQHLSGDLPVADFMLISTKATAADQVRAGKSGGLLVSAGSRG
jgi:hypothetical protein